MKIVVSIETGVVGADRHEEIEIDDSEMDGLTEAQIEALCDEYAREAFFNYCGYGWSKVEE